MTGYELIVTIVNKGWAEKVVSVAREAGAPGATVLGARGSDVPHEIISFLGIALHPEKELVLHVVPSDLSESIVAAIYDATNMQNPDTGISMVIPLNGVTGLCGQQFGKIECTCPGCNITQSDDYGTV